MEDIDRLELESESEDEELIKKDKNNETLSQNFLLKTNRSLDQTLTSGTYEGKTVKRESLKEDKSKKQRISKDEQEKAFEKLKQQKQSTIDDDSEAENISDIISDDDDEEKEDIDIFRPSTSKDKPKSSKTTEKRASSEESLAAGVADQKNVFNEMLKIRILVNKLSQKVKFMPQKDDFSKYYEANEDTKQKLDKQNSSMLKLLQSLMLLKNHKIKDSLSTYDEEQLKTKEAEFNKMHSATLQLQTANSTSQVWDLLQYQQSFFSDFMDKCFQDFDKKKKPNNKLSFKERISKKLEKQKETNLEDSQRSTAGDKLKVFGQQADDEFEDAKEEILDPEIYDDKVLYKSLLNTLNHEEGDEDDEGHLAGKKPKKAHKVKGLKTGKVLDYTPHEKLQNFMSPQTTTNANQLSSSASDILFNSLFGGKSVESFLKNLNNKKNI